MRIDIQTAEAMDIVSALSADAGRDIEGEFFNTASLKLDLAYKFTEAISAKHRSTFIEVVQIRRDKLNRAQLG